MSAPAKKSAVVVATVRGGVSGAVSVAARKVEKAQGQKR
jgi:hypothetical protein